MCSCTTRCTAIFVAALAAAMYGLYFMGTQSSLNRSIPMFNLAEPQFSVDDIPSLAGKIAIVTGANSGTGKENTYHLAKAGAHVVAACRSAKRCEAAITDIKERAAPTEVSIEVGLLDLGDLSSVKKFADWFLSKEMGLDILVLNAGLMNWEHKLSVDGIEHTFAVNHVGHHYLAKMLLPVVEKSAPSRIVVVSSNAYRRLPEKGIFNSNMDLETLNDPKKFSVAGNYGTSKLANILFSNELARQLKGKKVYVNSIHPGLVATGFIRGTTGIIEYLKDLVMEFVAYPVLEGTLTQLYAEVAPEIEEKEISGRYFVPIAIDEVPDRPESDVELAKQLWAFTEQLIAERT